MSASEKRGERRFPPPDSDPWPIPPWAQPAQRIPAATDPQQPAEHSGPGPVECAYCHQPHEVRRTRRLIVDSDAEDPQEPRAASRSGGRTYAPGRRTPGAPPSAGLGFSAPWSIEVAKVVGAAGRGAPSQPVPPFGRPRRRDDRRDEVH